MGYYSNAGQHLANVEMAGIAKVAGVAMGIKHLNAEKKISEATKSKEMYEKALEEMNNKTSLMNQQRTDFQKRQEVIMTFPNEDLGGVNNG